MDGDENTHTHACKYLCSYNEMELVSSNENIPCSSVKVKINEILVWGMICLCWEIFLHICLIDLLVSLISNGRGNIYFSAIDKYFVFLLHILDALRHILQVFFFYWSINLPVAILSRTKHDMFSCTSNIKPKFFHLYSTYLYIHRISLLFQLIFHRCAKLQNFIHALCCS
jgi:hypothetical protein